MANNILSMTVEDVKNWIISINYHKYANSIIENEVNGHILNSLSEDDWQKLGVTIFGHRRGIQMNLENLKNGQNSPPKSDAPPSYEQVIEIPSVQNITEEKNPTQPNDSSSARSESNSPPTESKLNVLPSALSPTEVPFRCCFVCRWLAMALYYFFKLIFYIFFVVIAAIVVILFVPVILHPHIFFLWIGAIKNPPANESRLNVTFTFIGIAFFQLFGSGAIGVITALSWASCVAFYRMPYAIKEMIKLGPNLSLTCNGNVMETFGWKEFGIWFSQLPKMVFDLLTLIPFVILLLTVHRLKSLFKRLRTQTIEDFINCRAHLIIWSELTYFGTSWNYSPQQR